jgi:cyclic beta-1,2-glucan synthetase
MGTGDWNDGMSQVGAEGQGESIWLGWFLIDVLKRFAAVLEEGSVGPPEEMARLAQEYRDRAAQYERSIEQTSWDGAWYRRAYYDDGTPLGSARSEECQIDSIAQSWSVISRAEPHANGSTPAAAVIAPASTATEAGARPQQAMRSVLERLVRPEDRLVLLFTPPFDQTSHNPGYIKGYLPGIRENGGQYTHAAIWVGWGLADLGQGDPAGRIFNLLNPIFQANQAHKVDQYRVEPYVICADIYSVPPYNRRGGWTWYTGSAAWMYRLGVERLLGLQISGGKTLRLDPVIPSAWDGFEITYRHGSSTYHIQVRNPNHVQRGVKSLEVEGQAVEAVTLVDDGQEYSVVVVMG